MISWIPCPELLKQWSFSGNPPTQLVPWNRQLSPVKPQDRWLLRLKYALVHFAINNWAALSASMAGDNGMIMVNENDIMTVTNDWWSMIITVSHSINWAAKESTNNDDFALLNFRVPNSSKECKSVPRLMGQQGTQGLPVWGCRNFFFQNKCPGMYRH
jgi:hypothetical protein